MAKKSKAKQPSKRLARGGGRRQERRFVSQSSANTWLVRALGGASALVLGAGLWAYFYAQSFTGDEKLSVVPSYLVAGGAILLGITIWIGTSSEPPVRVGAPGVSLEKGDLRRMPWWAIDAITFDAGAEALVLRGKDDAAVEWTFNVPLKAHPEAAAWIVAEASERVPLALELDDEARAKLPAASEHAGTKVDLEPLQVVGKRDALTGKIISYEPDARVCPRCERVYFKTTVPKACRCSASLAHLRPKDADDEADDDDEEAEG